MSKPLWERPAIEVIAELRRQERAVLARWHAMTRGKGGKR